MTETAHSKRPNASSCALWATAEGFCVATDQPRIGFIGAGRVATALALALDAAGYPVTAVSSRTRASSLKLAGRLSGARALGPSQEVLDAAEIIFIATPDDVIVGLVDSLRWRPGLAVVHTSGSESRDILTPAANEGAAIGALHPLQTFADRDHAVTTLAGSVFAVEADGSLRDTLLSMVSALGGTSVELKAEDKALYHASAVLVSNYVVALTDLAAGLWQNFGVGKPEAVRALLPLLKGAVQNLETLGLPDALTGPIARGDVATVRSHLTALSDAAPDLLPVYEALALQTIPVAIARGGLTTTAATQLTTLLTSPSGPDASPSPSP